MDTATIISFLKECLFLIVIFSGFLFYAVKFGRQSITNLILGLYFALLISVEFPYYEVLLNNTDSQKSKAILMILVFATFTFLSTKLFSRILPREYDENLFEGFWKKFLLATAGTVLIMIYSYHVLPVTDIITPGSPINYLFGSEQSFFWWLMLPFILLFLL